MNKTPLWFFWLLLLVPALVVAVFGFRLIAHEQDRAARAIELAQQSRVQSVADDLALAVQEVVSGITTTLGNLDRSRVESELAAMRRSNPIIRNVFLVASNGAALIPRQGHPADREEELFLQRYEPLLSGRVPWSGNESELAVNSKQPTVSSSAASRLDLGRLARSKSGYEAASDSESGPTQKHGWMPWFSGHQLYLLGWIRNPDGTVYGVELETAALLSRLLQVFPQQTGADDILLFVDGQGQVMHQVGSADRDSLLPAVKVPIGDMLPHWEVQLATASGAAAGSGSFMLVGGLLLCILVAAIVFGGSMLLWQAGRSRKDAMQKTSFVSNVSHELKTPLTTIRMYAEMLGEGRVSDETRRVSYLNTIIAESQRLTRLVNNVLDFSRLEQNRQAYNLEGVDLTAAIHEVLETQQDRLRALGMSVETETGAGLCVRTDRDALRQTLLNLIDNAAKYAAEGKAMRIELHDGDGIDLAVMDRGPGVAAGEWEKIFERFHRVDSSLTARQPGCGLGLTLARRIMRDVGADVVYRERAGGGATLCIMFPASLRVKNQGAAS